MKAAAPVPKSILRPIAREVEFLRALLGRGTLSSLEFALCLLLAESRGDPQSDEFLSGLMEMKQGEMQRHRRSLRQRGILDFTPARKPGSFSYRVHVCLKITGRRTHRRLVTGFPLTGRWFVLEHGTRAHLLRADDLFPAERALCGLPALDDDWQPLPHLNSQPADYQVCERCRFLCPFRP